MISRVIVIFQKTARNLIRRYLQRKHKVDLDAIDNYKRGHGVQNEEVLAKVHDYIEQARKQQGAVLQKTASFEVGGNPYKYQCCQVHMV